MSNNYNFISRVYRNDPIRTRIVHKKTKSDDIWNNKVVVYPMEKNIYFYVFASCYCDVNGDGKANYNVFFSPIKKQKAQYALQIKFNKIVKKEFPDWVDFDQANIIENGFRTLLKAQESKKIAIHEYRSNNFKVHELSWK